MIAFNCIVQEGIVPDDLRIKLASELRHISAPVLSLSEDEIEVNYYEIRHGFGFRGGEISTTSTVQGQLSEPIDQTTRVELMTQICDMWCAETGCSTDELIVSVRDPQ